MAAHFGIIFKPSWKSRRQYGGAVGSVGALQLEGSWFQVQGFLGHCFLCLCGFLSGFGGRWIGCKKWSLCVPFNVYSCLPYSVSYSDPDHHKACTEDEWKGVGKSWLKGELMDGWMDGWKNRPTIKWKVQFLGLLPKLKYISTLEPVKGSTYISHIHFLFFFHCFFNFFQTCTPGPQPGLPLF